MDQSNSVQCPRCSAVILVTDDSESNIIRVTCHFADAHFDILYNAILAGFNSL